MLKKIGMSALGVVVMLAWWTFTGRKDKVVDTGPHKMPVKFLSGGGGILTIEADSTAPAVMRYTFHGPLENGSAKDKVEGYEDVEAGHYSWATEITPNTGVYLELNAKNPKPGTTLNWTIKLNGKELASENETLNEELKPGYAFFLQYEHDDVANAEGN